MDGTYNTDTMGLSGLDNDEYMATLTAPRTPGRYEYAWRFSADGGRSWLYADLGGGCGGSGPPDGFSAPGALARPAPYVAVVGVLAQVDRGTDSYDTAALPCPWH